MPKSRQDFELSKTEREDFFLDPVAVRINDVSGDLVDYGTESVLVNDKGRLYEFSYSEIKSIVEI